MTRPKPASAEPAPSRRERKKADTRREIYLAAMRLFREGSFDAVTVEAICEEADVARGTFFLHFPTKAALLYEFNRQVALDFRERLNEPRGSAISELEVLVGMVRERIDAEADVMRAMLREYFSMAQPGPREARTVNRDLQELLESIIVRGQQRGELRASLSPSFVVASFLSTANAVLQGALPPGTSTDESIRQFFELMLDGMRSPRS
jgi:AcrR family transcriptional regulator